MFNNYRFWKDKKFLSLIFLILIFLLQIFSFLRVHVITTFHSYTVGLFFGYYSFFFYLFYTFLCLKVFFKNQIKYIEKYFIFNKTFYWLFVFAIINLSFSVSFSKKHNFFSLEHNYSSVFLNWFKNFTNNQKASFWFPQNTNGGLIGIFLYLFYSSFLFNLGSLIFSIISFLTFLLFISFKIFNLIIKKNNKNITNNIKKIPFEDPFNI